MDRSPTSFGDLSGLLEPAEVDQAAGMLSVQLDVSVAVAGARLRAYAADTDQAAVEVACDIVARRLHLSTFPAPRVGS